MKTLKITSSFKSLSSSSSKILDDFLPELAISLWRMEKSIAAEINPKTTLEETRTWKTVHRLLSRLQEKGLRILDHTGQYYDEGMALRVITSETRSDLSRNLIIETITPSVFLRENLIHAGEIIVGTPENK